MGYPEFAGKFIIVPTGYKLTGFNKKYGLFDGIGNSSIGSNKTGSRRIDKTHPTKKYINCIVQLQVLLNLRDLTRNTGYLTGLETPALGATRPVQGGSTKRIRRRNISIVSYNYRYYKLVDITEQRKPRSTITEAHAGLFRPVYKGDFRCLCTVTFWQKIYF